MALGLLKNKIDSMNFPLSKIQIKVLFAIFAVAIAFAVNLYTQQLANELIDREKQSTEFFADMFKHYYNDPNANANDFLFFLDRLMPTIKFPIILTDEKGEPLQPYELYAVNIKLDTTWDDARKADYLRKKAAEMSSVYDPINITDPNGKILQKVYYSHSRLIQNLKTLPYIEFGIVSLFVLLGYLAFSNIRRSEETRVWIGMAKEAAHQLGTPLSSILGWLEILKINRDDPRAVEETVREVYNDVDRLNIIANRFSKIGSEPKMEQEKVALIIEQACNYFEKRLPHLGKRVTIERNLDFKLLTNMNPDLFTWVIENLLKNGVEAIETAKGEIYIKLFYILKTKRIIISVTDSGKGMSSQMRRQIFMPGFTTKKRGWGLGLSLAKRIVEEYHGGKIYVKDSSPGRGTTFWIELDGWLDTPKKMLSELVE